MYFLPKHDHLVTGLKVHSNSLFNIDLEGPTVFRRVTGRRPVTPIYNQCAIDCQLDVGGGEASSAGSKLVFLFQSKQIGAKDCYEESMAGLVEVWTLDRRATAEINLWRVTR